METSEVYRIPTTRAISIKYSAFKIAVIACNTKPGILLSGGEELGSRIPSLVTPYNAWNCWDASASVEDAPPLIVTKDGLPRILIDEIMRPLPQESTQVLVAGI